MGSTPTPRMRHFLTGQLLVAMPGMPDHRFARAVIYICAHTADGAMGLVVNQRFDGADSAELLTQLGITGLERPVDLPLHRGGPVEQGRGFVLHTRDYDRDGTLGIDDDVALTATVEVLRAIAQGEGPRRSLLALGYAGWGPGQLDNEMLENGWLHVPADLGLLFDPHLDDKWERAIAKMGVSLPMLSADVGHA